MVPVYSRYLTCINSVYAMKDLKPGIYTAEQIGEFVGVQTQEIISITKSFGIENYLNKHFITNYSITHEVRQTNKRPKQYTIVITVSSKQNEENKIMSDDAKKLKELLEQVKAGTINIEDAAKAISSNGDSSLHIIDYVRDNVDTWVMGCRPKLADGNDNVEVVSTNERFKFVDTLTSYYKPKQTLTKYIKEKSGGRGIDFKDSEQTKASRWIFNSTKDYKMPEFARELILSAGRCSKDLDKQKSFIDENIFKNSTSIPFEAKDLRKAALDKATSDLEFQKAIVGS